MMGDRIHAPQIRFSGFSDDWEQRKLGDISEIITGGTPKTTEEKYWNPKEIPWMSSGEINNMRIVKTEDSISKNGFDNSSAKWVNKNSVLIALAGQGKTRGMVAVNEIKLTTNQSIAAIQPNCSLYYEFLFHNLGKRYEELRLISSGDGTRGGLNKKIISELNIFAPSYTEQKNIGILFKQIDLLITLHQCKLDKLINIKKSMLEKMFVEKNTDVPEIRFKGFTDTWEQRKLGDLSEIVRGASPRPIQDPKWFDESSDIGWLRISDVTNQNGRVYFLEQKISKLAQEKTRVLETPHLLLSIAASVGKPVINYTKTGVHDGFLIFINPKFDLYFMFQWLEMFKPIWQKYGQPGSQVNLNSDIVKNHKINIPSDHEQEHIGQFFEKIDKLITLHQRKLEKLKNIKTSCLEKMFV
ncbi:restriction endonuclease subunit S [Enterococcus cecorum]|nr:restriction endonuclease subunit S [Enterococcus cecorum]